MTGKHIFVSGRVQGVGFRYFTVEQAQRLGLVGWARNLADGRVEILAFGSDPDLQIFLDVIKRGPPYSDVTDFVADDAEMKAPLKEFSIRRDGGPLWPAK